MCLGDIRMKVKQIIRYYFLSAEAERRIERLILKKACKAFDARSAEDCVAEVVALTIKRQRLRELNSLLSWAMNTFTPQDRMVLYRYAFSRITEDEGKRAHRLAEAFARRIRSHSQGHAEGIAAMKEFCFFD